MSDEFQDLIGRFQRIANRNDTTPEAIRLAQAAGGRLILQAIQAGRFSLSKFATQEFHSVVPFLPTVEYLREHQLAFLWQVALTDVLPEDEQHLNDIADLHDVAEQNAAAAARLAATVAPIVTTPAVVTEHDQAGPPDELLAELSGTEQRIVSYLWSRTKVKRSAFVKAIWTGKANTPEAEGKAVRRLQITLHKLRSKPELRRYSNIKVTCCRGFVTFDKPDK